MSLRGSYLIILVMAVVLLIPISAYATGHYQEAGTMYPEEAKEAAAKMIAEDIPIDVWTDKIYYTHNDMIIVKGQVAEVSGFPVTLTVVSPLNSIVVIDVLQVYTDGSFETTLNTAGAMWKYDGAYTIKVSYGSAEKSNKVKVELSGGVTFEPDYSTPTTEAAPIVVTTDKASYSKGETILIFGEVRDLYGVPVGVIVKAPNGNLVSITQAAVSADKKFSTQLDAGGTLMKVGGEYTVVAQYGNANRSAETSFEFVGVMEDQIMEEESEITDTTISVQGSSDLIGYEITGGKLLSIISDADALSLIVNIDSFNDGLLTLTLPRTVIDARTDNDDSKFFILVDGEEKTYSEIVSSTDRIIIIHFKAGTEEIEIIGNRLSDYGLPTSNINPIPSYPQPILDTTPPKILKPIDITVNAKNQNGAVVTFDVLTIDDTDEIVNTVCTPASNSFFTIGETRIICNARDSSGNRAVPISFNITVNAAGSIIPEWVKNVAIFWCDDKIDDTSFIEGIQYLIENDIITVSITTSGFGIIQEIPQWIKNNACWWSKDLITDKEFTSGIEFLVNVGIIRV